MRDDGLNQQQRLQVPAGKDRFGGDGRKIWGLIPLATKLSGADIGRSMFVFEHRDMGKGGPPRHEQDEWFYVVRGEFAAEVGEERLRLKPGDSMFAPKMVPHAGANVGEEPGTLITIASVVGKFETFMHDTTRHATLPAGDRRGVCGTRDDGGGAAAEGGVSGEGSQQKG